MQQVRLPLYDFLNALPAKTFYDSVIFLTISNANRTHLANHSCVS